MAAPFSISLPRASIASPLKGVKGSGHGGSASARSGLRDAHHHNRHPDMQTGSSIPATLWTLPSDPFADPIKRTLEHVTKVVDTNAYDPQPLGPRPVGGERASTDRVPPDNFSVQLKTSLAIEFPDKVRSGSLASIVVAVTQERRKKYLSGKKPDEVTALDRTVWPIDFSLTIDSKKENKVLIGGSQLPARLQWAPLLDARHSEFVAVLRAEFNSPSLQKVALERTRIKINGEPREDSQPSDDIPLTISVYKFGMPAWLWEYISLGGSFLSFVLGCSFLTGALSRVWRRLFGRPREANYT